MASAPVPAEESTVTALDGCKLESGPSRTVTRIIDAETIGLDDGSEARLAGILAPRPPLSAPGANQWPPGMAADAALRQLVLGKTVDLGFSGRRSDRYGRLLVHAHVRQGTERIWVQGQLLSEGHARAYVLPESVACIDEMQQREKGAREAGLGMWAHSAFSVRDSRRITELMRLRSTYQIIEGRIEKVAGIRGSIYLNFGSDWRSDFSAGIAPAVRAAQFPDKKKLAAMEGKSVRVRGWIERRNGPYIEIVHPSQIEVLEPGTAAGRIEKRPEP